MKQLPKCVHETGSTALAPAGLHLLQCLQSAVAATLPCTIQLPNHICVHLACPSLPWFWLGACLPGRPRPIRLETRDQWTLQGGRVFPAHSSTTCRLDCDVRLGRWSPARLLQRQWGGGRRGLPVHGFCTWFMPCNLRPSATQPACQKQGPEEQGAAAPGAYAIGPRALVYY